MKKILYQLLLPLLLLASWSARAQTTLQQESFENALGSTSSQVDVTGNNTTVLVTPNGASTTTGTATATSGGTDQYFLRISNSTYSTDAPGFIQGTGTNGGVLPTNVNGTYYYAGEGVKGNDASVQVPPTRIGGRVTLKSISVAGYASLKVTVALLIARGGRAYDRMEADDTLRVQVRFNNAGNWITIGQLVGDNTAGAGAGYWRVDAGRDGSSADDVAAGTPTVGNPFSDFTFDVIGSGSTMQTRIVVAEQGSSEEFAFDNIRVTGVVSSNQAPVLSNIESTIIAYDEGQAAVNVTNTLLATDDGPTLTGATISFASTGFDNTEDRLLFTAQNGISIASNNTSTGVLTLTGTASLANYQAALRSVQYQNIDAIDATPGTRTINFAVTDGTSTSLSVSRSLTVTAYLEAAGGLPYTEDLETNGEGLRYTSNNAALLNGRYFDRTNVASEPGGQWHANGYSAVTISGINNSYYWWGSGTSLLPGGFGTFVTKQTNTTGYVNLNFSVKLAAPPDVWENQAYLKVYYRLNGGSWVPLLSFRSNDQTATNQGAPASTTGDLLQDTNPATTTGVPTGPQLTTTLTTYSASLPASANGQLVDFKIDQLSYTGDGVGEVIGFDYLRLTGTQIVAPTVVTAAATGVTPNSAVLGGNVTSDGGDAVTGRGVVYSASNSVPTIGGTGTTLVPNGTGTGSFAATISGLAPGTTYYVQAYAINSIGTSYGGVQTFTTPAALPTVTTAAATTISSSSAVLGGNVTAANGATVTARGVVYSLTSANGTPTIGGTGVTNAANGTGTGSFSATISGLSAGSSYSVQAYATNSAGTSYGGVQTFTTATTTPTVATAAATGVTSSSATLGGTVSADGGATVTARGIVYSLTSANGTPTIGGTGVTSAANGTGTGSFSTTASGLSPGTSYSVQAYATNANGTVYGGVQTFTTTANLPTVTTATPGSIGSTSAVLGGTVSADGGATVTARGVVYSVTSTNATPVIGGTGVTNALNGTGTGSFSALISSLTASTSYSVQAYATNSTGTSYGGVQTFTTAPNPPTTALNPPSRTVCAGGTTTFPATINGAASLQWQESPNGTSYTNLSNGGVYSGVTTATLTITGAPASLTGYVYRLVGTNSSGSATTTAATLTVSTVSLATGTSTNVSCNGGNNGTASVTPSGGTSPYTYSWSPSVSTTSTATGLAAGSYTVTVTDNIGCTAQRTFLITQPAALTSSVSSQTNVSCNGGTNGSATVSVGGGTPGYAYSWSPSGGTAATATGLSAGTYTVTITDANTCTKAQAVVISAPPALTATTSQTNVTTFGGSNGSATISVGGGTPGYSYAWSPNVSTTATASNLSAGSYTVTATDANGCTIQRTFLITQPAAPTITVSPAALPGAVVGQAYSQTLTASGGTAPYSFALTSGALPAGLTLTSGGLLSGTPTAGGTFSFTVTATDAGSFSGARTYSAFSAAAATITLSPTTLPNGTVASNYSQTITASGGTSPYSFAVTSGALPTGLTLTAGGLLSGTPLAPGTYNFTVTATDASTGTGAPYSGAQAYQVTIALPLSVVWTGLTSSDWFTAANWLPTVVPDATVDVVIPTAPSGNRYPTISANAAQATAQNLSIATNAALAMNANTLTLAANLTNNGAFNGFTGSGNSATGGTLVVGTSAAATLGGLGNYRYWNLSVGASGAQLSSSSTASVQRLLSLNGNLTTNGSSLTLVSDASGTAQVTNNGAAVVNGNVTVQRYITGDVNPNLGYRHVATAVSGQQVSNLTTGAFSPVVNPAYNGSSTPLATSPFPTVYGYDQSRLATVTNNLPDFDKGWVSPSATTDPLNVGQGYTVLIAAAQTWSFTGPLNNGTIALNLARNSGTTAANSGLALIGNPYPSPLDWSTVTAADRTNSVDGVIYLWRSNDPSNPYNGAYGTYNNGIGNISPVLAQGQGFFVRVTQGLTAGTLNLQNKHRPTAYAATTFRRQTPLTETRPLVRLSLQGAGGASASASSDDAFVYFEAGASSGYEPLYDAEKLPNPSGLNLSSSGAPPQRLAINGYAPLGSTQLVVPLAVGVPAAGSYSLEATELLNLSTVPTYLRDLQTGALVDLAQQPSYQFTVSNAAALITSRFELVFSPRQVLATTPAVLAQQVGLYPSPAKTSAFLSLPASLGGQPLSASLLDAVGRPVRAFALPAQGTAPHPLDLTGLATGVYALRLNTSAGVLVKKLVIE